MNSPSFYIVTPSFNRASYIDEVITSVVTQAGNFSIYYHVQDGDSTDGTAQRLACWEELLRKPNPLLRCNHLEFSWSSEPDSGMYQAINKGFSLRTIPAEGIMAWANTDDQYVPHAFAMVSKIFADIPALRWMSGAMYADHGTHKHIYTDTLNPIPQELINAGCCDGMCWRHLDQAPMFWKASLWQEAGPLDESFHYAGDYELWTRFAAHALFAHSAEGLAYYGMHNAQLSKRTDAQGVCCYDREKDRVRSREERTAAIRRYWNRHILPAKAYAIVLKEDAYALCRRRAWPVWGQGWRYCAHRIRYYGGKLVANLLSRSCSKS